MTENGRDMNVVSKLIWEGFRFSYSPHMHNLLREHIEAVSPLTQKEWDLVHPRFFLRTLRKRQFLVQPGDPVPCDHWVAKGLLKAYLLHPQERDPILQFAPEGWWCTDYQAFLHRTPATLYVDCMEASEVLTIRFEDRESLCREVHAMEHFFRVKSGLGYAALQRRIISLLQEPVTDRFRNFRKQYPGLNQRVPKKYLAAYLGVSRETLSRLTQEG